MKRENWSNRLTFILAAVGSAVGLGNAWRFPGLAAEYGGGAFLLAYAIMMVVMGVPLLMMEIAIGRHMRQGAIGGFRGINKKMEPIGWAATANAFVIVCYYAAVFGWVILMMFASFKFAGMTGDAAAASNLFGELTKTTWGVTPGDGAYDIPLPVLGCLLIAWASIWYCLRNGVKSVSKVVKFTVFAPVVLLLILAVRGLTLPGGLAGVKVFFVPDFSALLNADVWLAAAGQVFFSMSVMMAIMIAYGSYVQDSANIAVDTIIIAVSDMLVSVLAGIVMFSTMGGVGMTDSITSSGIVTAFLTYPQAIVKLTNVGWINAVFGVVFYLMLITLAIDSAFSIVEGVATAVADRLKLNRKKTTIAVICVAMVISVIYTTRAGLGWLDIVDNWTNMYIMIIIGVFECIAVGWCFKTTKVLDEINRNTVKFRMPGWWFLTSVKVISPVLLAVLVGMNLYKLFAEKGGVYGYEPWAEAIAGWAVMALVLASGFIAKAVIARKKKKGFVDDLPSWDEMTENRELPDEPGQ